MNVFSKLGITLIFQMSSGPQEFTHSINHLFIILDQSSFYENITVFPENENWFFRSYGRELDELDAGLDICCSAHT